MAMQDLIIPLDDLAYLIECAALDCNGELKSELMTVCSSIRAGAVGYRNPLVQASLPELEGALSALQADKTSAAKSRLTSVSRAWWAAARAAGRDEHGMP